MEEEMEELYAEGLATHGGPELAGDRAGQYSIRINRQWRICFRWTDAGPEDVEIADHH